MQHARPLPELDAGLTRLDVAEPRSRAFYRLVADALAERRGETLWIDARNHASTRALHDHAPRGRALEGVRIARAFTAYQHHTLVGDLPGRATSRTAMVVAPATVDLYRDPDVPDHETDRLLDATLTTLAATADALSIPVLVTTPRDDDLADRVEARADRTIEAAETAMGVAYEGPEFQTDAYWQDGYWQTTIPSWVDLLGAVGDQSPVEATFGELAEAEAEV